MEIKDDGTQTLQFKIPKYFYGEVPNTRLTNPRWKDVETGILAENTRVLKVTIQFADRTKVFPFIIDEIVNRRDKDFSVYKEVKGNGLAFAELGKIGYKLELTSDVLEDDFAEDDTVVANINYWLDKVFPNVRDEAGNVLRWLTPWSYEIRMDWRGYFQDASDFVIDGGNGANWQDKGFVFYDSKGVKQTLNNKDQNWLLINSGNSAQLYQVRDEEVIYEDAYVADWTVEQNEGVLRPVKVSSFEEKARYVNCQNSNKYNITQDIAEAFGVFCVYEYEVDQQGYFKGTYWDDMGRVWTGKKVVFYNRAVKTDNPITLNYQHNLSTISRTIDSSEIYTKLYITPIESELMSSGYITIADTPSNPLLDDFILNFDYMREIGSITETQYEWIEKTYKPELHRINKAILLNEEKFNTCQVDKNEAEAKLATAKNELASAQEQLGNYQALRDNDTFQTPVEKNKTNAYSVTFVPQTASNINQGTFRLTGIDASYIECYNNSSYEHENRLTGNNDYDTPKRCVFSTLGKVTDAAGNTYSVPTPTFTKDCPGQANVKGLENEWFITTDEDGFPSSVYTNLAHEFDGKPEGTFSKNFNTGAIYYFKLRYWPKNKYVAVCERFEQEILQKTALIESLERKLNHELDESYVVDAEPQYPEAYGYTQWLEQYEGAREQLQKEKDQLNYDFERLLGPAVREGYWQSSDYEDPGQGFNLTLSAEANRPEPNTFFFYDEEAFEEEQLGYYLMAPDAEDSYEYKRVYYPYIDLSNLTRENDDTIDKISEFVIELEHPEFSSEITEVSFPDDYYKFVYNSTFYYFKLGTTLPKGAQLLIKITNQVIPNSNNIRQIELYYKTSASAAATKVTSLTTTCPDNSKVWIDITSRFAGLQQFLGVRSLYNNAGFKLCFMDASEDPEVQKVIPIALLQETDINYENYTSVSYAPSATAPRYSTVVDDSGATIELKIQSNEETEYPLVYPRIAIQKKNVNYTSDNLMLRCSAKDTVDEEGNTVLADELVNFEDYTILLRKGEPYITFKITDNNPIRFIRHHEYNLIYQVSRANEMLYLDARQVAKDNSKPKYSYEVEIGNIPDEMECVELGQLVYVCDHTIDAGRERGYISEIKYQLDQPSKDNIVIANYKTKFEDLFSSITAQNEAMKQNQTVYNIAAQSFTSNGEIAQETLQNTLDNTEAVFSFGNNSITLDKNGGMIITNQNAYRNGVYGQIKLSAGGIYCSDSLDKDGERLWSTGMTPQGINASLITAGQIDTKYIRILSGDQTRFQWNADGLFAFADKAASAAPSSGLVIDTTTFVRLNEEGLLFQNNGQSLLSLGWDGLKIGAQDGSVRITSENGIEVYNKSNKRLVQLGRHKENSTDDSSLYGLAMYNTSDQKTLYTDQNGNLHLDGTLTIGSGEGYVCINGAATSNSDFVLYAGNESPMAAEFALRKDGKIFSKGVECQLTPVTTDTTT